MIEDESTGPNVTPDPPPAAGGAAPWAFGAIGLFLLLIGAAAAVAAYLILRN